MVNFKVDWTFEALSQNACREISHDLAFVKQFLDCYREKTAGDKVYAGIDKPM